MKHLLKNRKGQGTTEYIVIMAIAVMLVTTIFWGQIKGVLNSKVGGIVTGIHQAGVP